MMECADYSLETGGNEDIMGGKDKGMGHLTKRRLWWTGQVHTMEYQGKMELCHTPGSVYSV